MTVYIGTDGAEKAKCDFRYQANLQDRPIFYYHLDGLFDFNDEPERPDAIRFIPAYTSTEDLVADIETAQKEIKYLSDCIAVYQERLRVVSGEWKTQVVVNYREHWDQFEVVCVTCTCLEHTHISGEQNYTEEEKQTLYDLVKVKYERMICGDNSYDFTVEVVKQRERAKEKARELNLKLVVEQLPDNSLETVQRVNKYHARWGELMGDEPRCR